MTERDAQERLDARYRVALANSGVIVFEQDASLRYTWLGQTQFYAMEDVIGRTDAELFPAGDATELTALKQQVLSTGLSVSSEVKVTMNGRDHFYALTIEPVHDEAGQVVAITGASRNITAWKESEAALARALEFREQVMAILGHDLRSPLGAVSSGAQILLGRGDLSPEAEKTVQLMARSSARMREMIATLLDFGASRFHGALPVQLAPSDLADVIRSVVSEVEGSRSTARIVVDLTGDLRGTWDAARLGQACANLLGNALEHGDPDSVVRVTSRRSGPEILLEVHNRGAPIAPDLRPLLFQPFTPRERGAGRGLGLGLFITHHIVRAHGGTIEVESSEEEGTTFRARLPSTIALT